jgi:Kef-type K+ transport system membrane component KefB
VPSTIYRVRRFDRANHRATDTVGWIIMSVLFGLALHGAIDLVSLVKSLFGTTIFLVVSFTIGRQLVFRAIR